MPSCVVKKCKNHTCKQWKHTGVTYHLFPQEPQRRKTWVKIIQHERGDKNWQPSRKSVICSEHFTHNQMYDTEHRRRLMKTAVPDLIKHFTQTQFESHRADGLRKLKPNAVPTLFYVQNPPLGIDPIPRELLYQAGESQILLKHYLRFPKNTYTVMRDHSYAQHMIEDTDHVCEEEITTNRLDDVRVFANAPITPQHEVEDFNVSKLQRANENRRHRVENLKSLEISRDDDLAEAAQPGGGQSNQNVTVKRQNLQRKITAGSSAEAQKVSSMHGNVITQETENARITSDIDDKYDILGKYVASKLRQLDVEQRMYVERIIHEAIYEGQMGHLNINSQLVVNTETFVSGQTDKTKEFEITNVKKEKEDDPLKVSNCENNFEELPSLDNASCRSHLTSLEKPNDGSELNVKDVADIKIEIVTEEQDGLEQNSSTEYSVAAPFPSRNRVGEYVYMYSDNAKRKRPNETDYEVTHAAFQESNAKIDTEMKDTWSSQEIQFGSDSNVKIKEELSDS